MPDIKFSNKYPYTDFHELNLEWVIKEVKYWSTKVGKTIQSIELTGTAGLVDTYTINYSDGTTTTFDVTNGNGITSVAKTETAGLVDTYTITFQDGSTSEFYVRNGAEAVDPTLTLADYAADAKVTGDAIRDITTKTPNLFNPDVYAQTHTVTDGTITGTGQDFTDTQSTLPGITFKANTRYIFSATIYTDGNVSTQAINGLVISFWNSSNTRIGRLNILNSTTTPTFFSLTSTAGQNIAYMTIGGSSAPLNIWHLSNIMVAEMDQAKDYIPFTTAGDLITRRSLRWNNKTLVAFGDSRTWYDKHAYTATTKAEWRDKICTGYLEQIRILCNMTVQNEGVSGETSTEICTRIRAFNFTGFDAVLLEGGVNDWIKSGQVTIGQLEPIGSSFDTSTVYGAWQSAVEYILTNYPGVVVYMDVPAIAWANSPETVFPYTTAEIKKNVAELYNLPCLDLYKKSGINSMNRDYFYVDDTSLTNNWHLHFNDYGNKKIGQLLAEFIESC